MQIIIPMSGFGERFRRAGYSVPKPLISLEGKTIIEHVVDMFPGERDFIFICNQAHLDEPSYRMAEVLRACCPSGRIVGIPPHKLGPIHAVRSVERLIDPDRPAVVNYCDFTCYWDWLAFRRFVADSGCAGAIPAYRGFHPHSLGTTNYAYLRESGGWALDIQEKQPYTDDRMSEYASSGTYYFASGRLMLEAFAATMAQNLTVGGEYYVSLAYKPLLADGQRIAVYPLQHFMQWGTPEDVEEYRYWSEAFRALASPATHASSTATGSVILPMAGLGQRFADAGYAQTKPLIPVSGEPMVVQATRDLPSAARYAFVLRRDMPGHDTVATTLATRFPGATIETIAAVTEGQACTALIGLEALEKSSAGATLPEPITIGACDNGALYDHQAFARLAADPSVDVIVWGIRGYPNAIRHPRMYGWIAADNGRITAVSVKQPLAAPATDPIVLGTFTFRRAADFRRAVERMMARAARVNGEYYIDTCINDAIALGLNCRLFEVDRYLCWGTPNDLRTFEYWQSCFHKWSGHPYRLEHDRRIPEHARATLEARYRATIPALPEPRP